MKNKNFFWVSYADLMTSMFFVMLVLFIITIAILHNQKAETETILENIQNVEKALQKIDTTYFEFNESTKRYKLKVDINFPSNQSNIEKLSYETRKKLVKAGTDLYNSMDSLISKSDSVDYLIIVEGNTSRYLDNYKTSAGIETGYKLSYNRALALVDLWKDNGIDFHSLGKQCEIIIAGSGYFGQSREDDESLNKRFTIQITSKIGKLLKRTNEKKKD